MVRSKMFNGKKYTLYGVYTTRTQREYNKRDVKARKGWHVRTSREALIDYPQCKGGAYLLWVNKER
jgi:hypothetical protein